MYGDLMIFLSGTEDTDNLICKCILNCYTLE